MLWFLRQTRFGRCCPCKCHCLLLKMAFLGKFATIKRIFMTPFLIENLMRLAMTQASYVMLKVLERTSCSFFIVQTGTGVIGGCHVENNDI